MVQWAVFPGGADYLQDSTPPVAADIDDEQVATFASWIRFPTQRSFDYIFATRNTIGLEVLTDGTLGRMVAKLDDDVTVVEVPGVVLDVDVWHHVVIVIDHTSAGADEMTMYINGSAGTPQSIAALDDCPADALAIGAHVGGSSPYLGDIATTEFYKDLATSGEIIAAHAGGVGTLLGINDPVTIVDFTVEPAPLGATLTDPQSNVYTVNGNVVLDNDLVVELAGGIPVPGL